MAKKEKNLSQEQIKIRILAFLFNKGDKGPNAGANAYTIQHKANIPLQEYARLRTFLEELCKLQCLQKYEEETPGDKPRIKYMITEQGKKITIIYRDSMQPLFGSIEESF